MAPTLYLRDREALRAAPSATSLETQYPVWGSLPTKAAWETWGCAVRYMQGMSESVVEVKLRYCTAVP